MMNISDSEKRAIRCLRDLGHRSDKIVKTIYNVILKLLSIEVRKTDGYSTAKRNLTNYTYG